MSYHINFIYFSLLLVLCPPNLSSQAFLHNPMAGEEFIDYTIVNYVDWDIQNLHDHECGSKTYDGHEGTDFTLASFEDMDEGHDVLAAAAGEVVFVLDSLFDRETISDVVKGLGNYIAIHHANDYYSYYGHLKKNSSLVQIGQHVEAGQIIAQVGSSGNSSDPHLHFELWFDSLYVVDPFMGECGNGISLWVDEITYETDFRIWESGLSETNLNLDLLRERENLLDCCPFVLENTDTNVSSYWAQIIGLRTGDMLTIEWYTPQEELWYDYEIEIQQDWWYYYYWSFIDPGNLVDGLWNVRLKVNGDEKDKIDFIIDNVSSTDNIEQYDCRVVDRDQIKKSEYYDLNGKRVNKESFGIQKHRIYIEKIFLLDGRICIRKIIH